MTDMLSKLEAFTGVDPDEDNLEGLISLLSEEQQQELLKDVANSMYIFQEYNTYNIFSFLLNISPNLPSMYFRCVSPSPPPIYVPQTWPQKRQPKTQNHCLSDLSKKDAWVSVF